MNEQRGGRGELERLPSSQPSFRSGAQHQEAPHEHPLREGAQWQTSGSLDTTASGKSGPFLGNPDFSFLQMWPFPSLARQIWHQTKISKNNHLLFLSPNSRGIKSNSTNKMPITQPTHLPHRASTTEQMTHLDESIGEAWAWEGSLW